LEEGEGLSDHLVASHFLVIVDRAHAASFVEDQPLLKAMLS
jgi:hypothetical protein